MTQWEYRVERVHVSLNGWYLHSPEFKGFGDYLNDVGAEGWELVAMVNEPPYPSVEFVLTFKRAVAAPSHWYSQDGLHISRPGPPAPSRPEAPERIGRKIITCHGCGQDMWVGETCHYCAVDPPHAVSDHSVLPS